MRKIDVDNWNRKNTYNWFKTFSNPCWGLSKEMDVTSIVKYSKDSKTSFFINMLYVVVRTLNEFESMRMRYVDGCPFVYDLCSPAYTVMMACGVYENVRHEYYEEYTKFYSLARSHIEKSKKKMVPGGGYNPLNRYDEFYISSLPWVEFSDVVQPIPDDKGSQSVPRICWGKFFERESKFVMNFNVTVNHMFCDGYDVASFYLKLQDNIIDFEKLINNG